MDSTTEMANSEHIMDLNNKSVKHSSFVIQSSSVSIEHPFVNCNGNTSTEHDTSTLMNGVVKCDNSEDENLCNNSRMTNSSQCSVSMVQKSVCSLETNLSHLSISAENSSNHVSDQTSESIHGNCDKLQEISDCQEPNSISTSSDETKSRSDICSDTNSMSKNDTCIKKDNDSEITYICYESESQMPDIMKLIQNDLSEPYSIYTYRYFIHNWPHLCFLATCKGKSVGAIVCKLDIHRKVIKRGYIAMLAVDECYRKHGIGSNLVLKAIRVMAAEGADEVVLETEITNHPALRLYENLGFVRDKRLFRYYLNGVDALRLKLWLR